MFKRKSKEERYFKKETKDIIKIKKEIKKAKFDGENHVELRNLFILRNELSSDVFRSSVISVLDYFADTGYGIIIVHDRFFNIMSIIIRWNK